MMILKRREYAFTNFYLSADIHIGNCGDWSVQKEKHVAADRSVLGCFDSQKCC